MSSTLWITLVFLCYIAVSECKSNTRHVVRKFPEGFLFGASTAAYQIEGGWNEDGKSESIWDTLAHKEPCVIKNCDNGDVAADSYHQYKRDVEMTRELGLDFYRFSLSWSRILPSGFPDKINPAGVDYYNNLINELLKYNIQPMITIYHYDLPQILQDMGGWANPHIVDWYTDYSRTIFELFGDRVKYWITMNEPHEICYRGYAGKSNAPMIEVNGYAEYLCTKHLLLAHAKTYHIYNNDFREKYDGIVGITLSANWDEPENEDHVKAAEETALFVWGQYAHPIFSEKGDFPEIMKARIAAKSAEQGFPRSRLPELTPEEVELIRGSSDFFGLNSYTANIVYRNDSVNGAYPSPSFYDDLEILTYQPNDWEMSASSWLKITPWGFYKLLTKIRTDYNNPPLFITENGVTTFEDLDDDIRVSYYRRYLDALLDAVDEGSDIRVYTAWSLMDNFEWLAGYSERFGLYEVDYDSPQRTRTPRKSAFVYKEIVRTRALDWHYEPDTSVMTIDQGK